MKKYLILIASLLIFFISFNNHEVVSADELSEYEADYNKWIEEGVISSDITLQEWIEAKKAEAEGLKWIEEEAQEFELSQTTNPFSILSYAEIKIGDIIVTNGTSALGLTGHAGIAISSTEILSIEGSNHYPRTMTVAQWKARYHDRSGRWSRVYRVKEPIDRTSSAAWAKINYNNKTNISYAITTNISSKNPTYCSKIVWQVYRYGASSSTINTPTGNIVLPYSLPNLFTSKMELQQIKYL